MTSEDEYQRISYHSQLCCCARTIDDHGKISYQHDGECPIHGWGYKTLNFGDGEEIKQRLSNALRQRSDDDSR